jgi:HTH-type transcriptional regulator, sugar sensing transcriptional regulator
LTQEEKVWIVGAMDLEQSLQKLGLAAKEASVYLALLQLGQAPVQTIARKAGIVRPTTYVVLEALIRKGVVQKGILGKKTVFIASPPEELDRLIRQQQVHIAEQKEDLERLLPELRALFALAEERPSIRLFEGKEGLKNLQREFIEISPDEVVGISSDDAMTELFPIRSEEFDREIRSIRLKANVWSRHIYVSARGKVHSKESDKSAHRESRYVPPEKLPINCSFSVHGPLLSIVTFRRKIIGVLLEHQDIADSFRAIFEAAWRAAEKYNVSP